MDITHKITQPRRKNGRWAKLPAKEIKQYSAVYSTLTAKVLIVFYIYRLGVPTVAFSNNTFAIGNITKHSLVALALITLLISFEHQQQEKLNGVK